tara:strand:- start:424 stop:738 length:315 start_codon:yes stop_codon:yes gene_type:complete
MKKTLSLLVIFAFVISCASPEVVNVIGPNDNKLSCKELSNEIARANELADKAQQAKKMDQAHNLGAILFFLPGYGMTMNNIAEATKAAKERTLHLNKIKERKNC